MLSYLPEYLDLGFLLPEPVDGEFVRPRGNNQPAVARTPGNPGVGRSNSDREIAGDRLGLSGWIGFDDDHMASYGKPRKFDEDRTGGLGGKIERGVAPKSDPVTTHGTAADGRQSCRARVGLSVYISVGALSLQKTISKIKKNRKK